MEPRTTRPEPEVAGVGPLPDRKRQASLVGVGVGKSTRTQPFWMLAGDYLVMGMSCSIDALFEQHYARLVRSLAVAFDAESAADAVQDAFIEADRRWTKVSRYTDPAGWIRRVAINRLLNDRRNRWRRGEILSSIPVPHTDNRTAEHIDLRAAVDELPVQMRLAVCLHYLADLSIDEVAATLDIAPGTVKSHLHDGRRRLRTILEDENHG